MSSKEVTLFLSWPIEQCILGNLVMYIMYVYKCNALALVCNSNARWLCSIVTCNLNKLVRMQEVELAFYM